jgi:hypothetical protein
MHCLFSFRCHLDIFSSPSELISEFTLSIKTQISERFLVSRFNKGCLMLITVFRCLWRDDWTPYNYSADSLTYRCICLRPTFFSLLQHLKHCILSIFLLAKSDAQ